MQTTSTLLPMFWALAVLAGLFSHNYTSNAKAKFFSLRGLGVSVVSLLASVLIAKTSASYPDWQVTLSFVTYALAGYAGGVLSFYTRKLYAR